MKLRHYQGLSTLDNRRPGDPGEHIRAGRELAALFRRANAQTLIYLVSTWSRADLTYPKGQLWSGKPIDAMAADVAAANALALNGPLKMTDDIPVGLAWNRAMAEGVADPNPYDGIAFEKLDLWATDHLHASSYGYYLEALVVFDTVTGADPRSLGDKERAAFELGFSPAITAALQRVAAAQLIASGKIVDAPAPRAPLTPPR